jgi:hypothetical protein
MWVSFPFTVRQWWLRHIMSTSKDNEGSLGLKTGRAWNWPHTYSNIGCVLVLWFLRLEFSVQLWFSGMRDIERWRFSSESTIIAVVIFRVNVYCGVWKACLDQISNGLWRTWQAEKYRNIVQSGASRSFRSHSPPIEWSLLSNSVPPEPENSLPCSQAPATGPFPECLVRIRIPKTPINIRTDEGICRACRNFENFQHLTRVILLYGR